MSRRLTLSALLLCLFAFPVSAGTCPAPKPAICPNNPCDNLGTSQLSDDHSSLVVCLQKSGTDTTLSWKSMVTSGVPVGSVVVWPALIDPPDMGNWLECDGTIITQKDYPELFAVVGGRVPDMRGLFLRGRGGAAGAVGAKQGFATYIPNATATITLSGISQGTAIYSGEAACGSGRNYSFDLKIGRDTYYSGGCDSAVYKPGGSQSFSSTQTISTGATETRPDNMAVRYLIRAKP